MSPAERSILDLLRRADYGRGAGSTAVSISVSLDLHIRTVNKALGRLEETGRVWNSGHRMAPRGKGERLWSAKKPTVLFGMDLFDHDGKGFLELQRDDEDAEYQSDDAAWEEFIYILKSTSPTNHERELAISKAIALLQNWREPMADVMRGKPPYMEV